MKKMFSIVAAVLCAACIGAGATNATEFTDMPEGKAGEVISKAVENGLLTGYEDNTVRPDNYITRSQMAAIMVRALGATELADISVFTDVTEDKWYYADMAKAVFMEAFKGDGEKLNPENSITRQEALIVLSRIFVLPDAEISVLDKFNDGTDVSEWAKAEVAKVVAGNYVEGDVLRPLDNMTRLEFSEIMDKLVSVYVNEAITFTNENLPEGNILIKTDGVKFENADVLQNVFIGDGVKETTTFSECNTERIIIRGGNCSVIAGVHGYVRAIGERSFLTLTQSPKPAQSGVPTFLSAPNAVRLSFGVIKFDESESDSKEISE